MSSIICLLESSTCFEQLCAHPEGDNCMNTTSGIITLKISEWSKIIKITRIHYLFVKSSCISAGPCTMCIIYVLVLKQCTLRGSWKQNSSQ